MKFLLDANLPYSTKEIFSPKDTVVHVRDIGLESAADEAISGWAIQHRAVLISRDFDFANSLRFPPRAHSGIVVLKIRSSYTATDIKRVLRGFLAVADQSTFDRAIIIVEEGRFRIRR